MTQEARGRRKEKWVSRCSSCPPASGPQDCMCAPPLHGHLWGNAQPPPRRREGVFLAALLTLECLQPGFPDGSPRSASALVASSSSCWAPLVYF